MTQLRQNAERLGDLDVAVLVVGSEDAEAFRKFWEEESMPFKGLPDPEHSVLNLYGQETKILKLGRMPAQMLIDKSGILKFVYYGEAMTDIPELVEIEKALRAE